MEEATDVERLVWVREACLSGKAKAIRIDGHIATSDLGEELAVDQATVAMWERGDRQPRREVALRYEAALRRIHRATEQSRRVAS